MGADIESIALSNSLHTLAERFVIEASIWHDPTAKGECERAARLLAELARGAASGAVEKDTAAAYVDAAELIIRQVEGARRFFLAVATVPTVARRMPKGDQ